MRPLHCAGYGCYADIVANLLKLGVITNHALTKPMLLHPIAFRVCVVCALRQADPHALDSNGRNAVSSL
jgi:hypothetical protein